MKKATSLQRSLSCENESEAIAKLGHNNALPLSFGSGLETLQLSATMTVIHGFFMPLNQFLIGRGGVVRCNSGLSVKATRRLLLAVSNTPIALESNHLEKTKGEHFHA